MSWSWTEKLTHCVTIYQTWNITAASLYKHKNIHDLSIIRWFSPQRNSPLPGIVLANACCAFRSMNHLTVMSGYLPSRCPGCTRTGFTNAFATRTDPDRTSSNQIKKHVSQVWQLSITGDRAYWVHIRFVRTTIDFKAVY